MFTAPLDYALWRYLDERSTIASRLYEFLLLNFYSGVPILRINYETLVQFLPIRPERYLSDAKKQIGNALQLLTDTNVIADATWNIAASALTAIGVRTYNGDVRIRSAGGAQLLFDNNQLSQTGGAVVTFANTANDNGSDVNVVVSGTVHA